MFVLWFIGWSIVIIVLLVIGIVMVIVIQAKSQHLAGVRFKDVFACAVGGGLGARGFRAPVDLGVQDET